MKIVNSHAEAHLYEKVESLSQEPHDSWRCIYLKLSDEKGRYNNELRTHFVVRTLTDVLAETDGFIYLCEDGDIFILFQGNLRAVVSKLSLHFGDLAPEQLRGRPKDNPFSIFDLGKHWQGFYHLCESKYLNTLAASEYVRGNFAHQPTRPVPRAS